MIKRLFSSTTEAIKKIFHSIINFPAFAKNQIAKLKKELNSLHYHLNNMTDSNMRLGIYHVYSRNYNDAIFRLQMINKFLAPNNKKANYWLGWTYLLKENYKKSIIHLTKAEDEDSINLLSFVKSINQTQSIPDEIYQIHRDIMAELFINKFISDDVNLPKQLILELSKSITTLPEEYKILDLGGNIGLLSYEINKRMQDKYQLTSVEISNLMINLHSTYFPKQKLYDEILQIPVSNFLKQNKQTYDVIVSVDGITFEADLQNIFNSIFSQLNTSGYFAFAVQSSADSRFSSKQMEFFYNHKEIKERLIQSRFEILSDKELSLERKNNYSMFVCTKLLISKR